MNKYIRKILIICFWVIIWQIVSMAVGNSILLVGPVKCLQAFADNMLEAVFWKTIAISVARISLGFFLGLIMGLIMAIISAKKTWFEQLIQPVMLLIKSIPVASFVVIFLIWWGSHWLASVISFMVVLPNIYINTLEGIKSTDTALLEMAKVYDVSPWNKFFYIYRPSVKPFLDSSMKISVGLSFKSGVAAEVIGTPAFSIGERLYMSKIYLETADVFAWTAVVIILSFVCERLVVGVWNWFCNWNPECSKPINKNANNFIDVDLEQTTAFCVKGLEKCYDGKKIIENMSKSYEYGNTYYMKEPSGSGKTTFFRIISGLESFDAGKLSFNSTQNEIAYMFQEDRLCEDFNAVKNVALVNGDEHEARKQLLCLLSEQDIEKPCSQLSGGMKRRVALVRAFAANKDIILLDEPFTGIDNNTRMRVEKYIDEQKEGKCLIIATHI